ncbi:MAG: GPW/gp25 family protein [Bacillota bacterium]|nr:GPW/gp25 family protein [Bacillota bacterium]
MPDNPRLGVDLAWDKGDLQATPQGDLALVADRANVRAAVLRRLHTPLGALFYDPLYGNSIYDLLSEPLDEVWAARAVRAVKACLSREPRVMVKDIVTELLPESRLARFTITYLILDDPEPENLVWEVPVSV